MDIGRVLKDEIRRLARAEVRKQASTLKKASAQYRRDIAALKRELGAAHKRIAQLETTLASTAKVRPAPVANTEGRRFSGARLRAHREKLGLSRDSYAALAGVSASSLYLWERGSHRPSEAIFARLLAVRKLGKRAAEARLALLDD